MPVLEVAVVAPLAFSPGLGRTVPLVTSMLLELLALLAELSCLVLRGRDQELLTDLFVEVLVDYGRLPGGGLVLILLRAVRDILAIVGGLVFGDLRVEVLLDPLDLLVLAQLLDHGLEGPCLTLLPKVDSLAVDSDPPAHLEVLELERLAPVLGGSGGHLLI